MVDTFVGDEAIGLFVAGISGTEHTAAAIRAVRALLDAVWRADASHSGPIPVGAAVHTGASFVGSTGAADVVNDFTALGDGVNTTARLAGEAAAGELLLSITAAKAGGVDSLLLEPHTQRPRPFRQRRGRRAEIVHDPPIAPPRYLRTSDQVAGPVIHLRFIGLGPLIIAALDT